ncbi:MAG: J domain-containing protein [Candidatus Binataceae bacterium]|nr:J domain-containing protein [Candidatus Binataceae bacterium]
MKSAGSYPLAWPAGWKRTRPGHGLTALFRDRGTRLNFAAAMKRLVWQLQMLGAINPILSTNVELRIDGSPRLDRPGPSDTGVAVYFTLKGRRLVLACDRWNRVADNIGAIAAHIDAMRAQARHGVGSVEQAFAGYLAIENRAWRTVLGVDDDYSLEDAETAYRNLARQHHPDNGGSHTAMAELNAAIAAAREELRRSGG